MAFYESESGYKKALQAAGATVFCFQEFGSYQGDWLAKVEFTHPDAGNVSGWIHGYYGSCSGCDSFEAEFGFDATQETPQKLAKFGKHYLEHEFFTFEQVLEKASRNLDWDEDAKLMVKFLQENK